MIPKDAQFYLRKRYYIMALLFLGNCIMFILRVNLSICLVEMTSKKTVTVANITHIQEPEFVWTPSERGIILGSFSWGMLTAPLSVIIVKKLGASNTLGLAIFMTGLFSMLSPFLIQYGLYIFVIGRFLEGVTEALAISASYKVCANWIPPKETSRLMNIQTKGSMVGIVIGYSLSGYLSYLLNWRWVFYITGGIAIIWSSIWYLVVSDSPSKDNLISKTEKLYLQTVIECTSKKQELYLWKNILKSKPVLAYLNELFVESWSFSFLTYYLPIFIKDVHDVNINQIGILSSLPHIGNIIVGVLSSFLQDYLRNKGTMSFTKIHKIYLFTAQGAATILLLIAGFWHNFYGCFVLFCLIRIFFALAETSYAVLPLDMAGGHLAKIHSLKCTSLGIGYFLNPMIMSYMVANHTYSEWSRYFWFLGGFNLWALLVFARYGSAKLQPWAAPEIPSSQEKTPDSS